MSNCNRTYINVSNSIVPRQPRHMSLLVNARRRRVVVVFDRNGDFVGSASIPSEVARVVARYSTSNASWRMEVVTLEVAPGWELRSPEQARGSELAGAEGGDPYCPDASSVRAMSESLGLSDLPDQVVADFIRDHLPDAWERYLRHAQGATPPPVVVTRHPALVELLRELGLIGDDAHVISHATADDVRGRDVYGVAPLHLAAEARSVTEVVLDNSPDLRDQELTLEQLRELFRGVVTYEVKRVERS